MSLKQQTIDTYNKSSAFFISEFNNLGARKKDINQAFSYIQKTNPKVLEIGCGNGRDAKEILKKTNHYLGIDISEKLVEEAKRVNPLGDFSIADIETFTIPKNLDIIFAFASLLHISKTAVRKILERAEKALNPEGIFFISLKKGDYHRETKTERTGSRTYYFYTPEGIGILAPSGLKMIYKDFQNIRNQDWFTIILQKA